MALFAALLGVLVAAQLCAAALVAAGALLLRSLK